MARLTLPRTARPPRSPEPGSVALELRGVHVRRGQRTVLRSIDLKLRAGEMVALVGPNGSGKSSLLAAVAGDVPIALGSIRLDGAAIGSWNAIESAMRRSVLLQQTRVAFPFPAVDVVRMGRAPWSGTDAEDGDDAAVAAAMDDVDVASLADRRVTELSGGERARVALARVLAQAAAVMLLDEPTAALDVHHQEHVMEILRDRARRGMAVLIVLHDLDLAAAHADSIAILDDGVLVAQGAPDDVLTESRLSAVYRRSIEVLSHPRTHHKLVMPRR